MMHGTINIKSISTLSSNVVRLPGRGKSLFSTPKRKDRIWGTSLLSFNGYRGSFCEIKRLRRATDLHLHLEPTLRMSRAVSLTAHMPSLCPEGQNYLLSPSFVGAFAKFWKASISFVMSCLSVCLSVRPQGTIRGPTGRIFIKFDVYFFSKISRQKPTFIEIL